MAKISFLLCSVLVLLAISEARNAPSITTINDSPSNLTKIYTKICDPQRFNDLGLDMDYFTYCDSSLSYGVRVKDLIDRMTLMEKVQQIGDTAYGVPRIGLAKYEWWSEALHGVSKVGQLNSKATFFDDVVPGATSFPCPITTTASFNQTLWKTIGQVVSTEARAMYNLGHAGLTFWSPNINVVRDPRWGRTLETPGEDPFVVGTYAANYVRGLQDIEGLESTDDPNSRPVKVAACCKHYAAYDVDSWLGVDRTTYDALVTEQDMLETFQKPFEMCVKEGDVMSVMCSFNRINGIPACADQKLLKDTLRGEWDLHGYIVSDCDSIEVMVDNQKWLHDEPEDAVSQAMKAGLDLDCGNYYTNYADKAVMQGKISEKDIDEALKNLYIVLMRLGFFDGSSKYESLGKQDVCSDENIELATQAAREGMVLLKNLNGTLPLNTDEIKTIAVVGPHANATTAMIGNYEGIPCKYTSPIDGFSKYAEVQYAMGCGDIMCKNASLIFPAMQAAKNADATVIVAGIDLSIEAESRDRLDLRVPGFQAQLITQVAQVAKGPVILVIMSGGGVDISFARDSDNVKGIVWAGYPGEEGGQAIADVIFGKYNPGGRLPLTWHEGSYADMLPMTSMSLRPVDSLGYPGRTYKFFNGSTVFPFGSGLSYTTFAYSLTSADKNLNIQLNKFQHCRDLNYTDDTFKPPCPAILTSDLQCDDNNLEFEVKVTNNGTVDGSEVVMVYWVPPKGIVEGPIKQVIGFQKVFLPAGGSQKVKFQLNACKSFGLVNYRGYHLLPSGGHSVMIGDNLLSFAVGINFQPA
ncbi:beta-xylosidase alpha-L-arabinofuranosidase 1-like [Olea europaea subsp. europaea]|uniref:Beta-xylosidase alpha-L-arabinofuranosidase 1-like n=1 Tax=Olea europaea subsp. europaea TaxID=158383 RepID=A0A8S0SKB5_OLEEU|nr:beta-xylosidase alpha-L-arabinofuranosidase 1-like [Olea europaea subsp. europaea]